MSIIYGATVEDSPTHHMIFTDLDIVELYNYLVLAQFAGRKQPKILMHRDLSPKEEISFLLLRDIIGKYNYENIIKESSMVELERVYSFSKAKCERCAKVTPHLRGLCHLCTGNQSILGVSILVNDKIYKLPEPSRHSDLIHQIRAEGVHGCITQKAQGFYSASHDFITREEARDLAVKTGQCSNPDHASLLFSEDLW